MTATVNTLRKDALSIFQQGIDAADPYQAVKNCLTVADNHIEIALDVNDSTKKRRGRWSKIYIIAFGKASCRMAQAATETIPAHRVAGKPIAISNYDNVIDLKNVEVLGAGHPIPDSAGMDAAKRIEKFVARRITELQK